MKKILLTTISILLFVLPQSFAQRDMTVDLIWGADSSLSNILDTKGHYLTGIRLPVGFEGTSLTFQDSWDGIEFSNVILKDGSELKYTIDASSNRKVSKIDPRDAVLFAPFVRVRSGTAAVPTVQTEADTAIAELKLTY